MAKASGISPNAGRLPADQRRDVIIGAAMTVFAGRPFDTVRAVGQIGIIHPITDFFTAAKAGKLPNVTWIVPSQAVREHPPGLARAVVQGPWTGDSPPALVPARGSCAGADSAGAAARGRGGAG